MTLKEYVDAYGVDVNFLYNTKSQLVKKGALPGANPKAASESVDNEALLPWYANLLYSNGITAREPGD